MVELFEQESDSGEACDDERVYKQIDEASAVFTGRGETPEQNRCFPRRKMS